MVQCYVPNCKNRSDSQNWKKTSNVDKNRKITFHSIPKNNTSRNLWIDILDLPSYTPNSARICSDHFSEESFDKINGLATRLRPNVLPLNKCEKYVAKKKIENNYSVACPQSSTADKEMMTSIQPYTAEKATMVSLKRIYNSPEKCRLRKMLKYQKEAYTKKIRNLQHTIRRRNEQLSTLKDVLNTLRQKCPLETKQIEMLLTLDGSNDELFNKQNSSTLYRN